MIKLLTCIISLYTTILPLPGRITIKLLPHNIITLTTTTPLTLLLPDRT